MTLDHLATVTQCIIGVVEALAAGREVPGVVSTADVKPSPAADASAVERFGAGAADYLARVERIADLRSAGTHPHPWFGPLTALGWHRLAAVHHGIHRQQVEHIARAL
jgi:hypothetical protein